MRDVGKIKLKKIMAKSGPNKGFSLVELLMVIAIVGILSTIILNSISISRARAYDSKIKQQLNSFRTSAEIYFSRQSPNSYGVANICNTGIFADLDPANGSPGIYLQSQNLPSFTQVVCGANVSVYAVKATLFSGNEYWCVDSRGSSELVSDAIGSSVTSCP